MKTTHWGGSPIGCCNGSLAETGPKLDPRFRDSAERALIGS
jgi:hypothetical protein